MLPTSSIGSRGSSYREVTMKAREVVFVAGRRPPLGQSGAGGR